MKTNILVYVYSNWNKLLLQKESSSYYVHLSKEIKMHSVICVTGLYTVQGVEWEMCA